MVIDHTHHKRSRSSHSDDKATKRPKITDERMNMDAFAFQTPYPNHEVQSVAYQLPSSSPQPSPGPLSPVPPVPVSKKKERSKRTRSKTGPNAISTPVERRTDLTPPSFTLRRALRNDDSSRSASRSSHSSKSTASSRANSRERESRKPGHYHRQPASQLKHAKSLGALDGDNSGLLTNTDGAKKYGHGRGSKNKSKQFTLDSPYVSRASSPVQLEKTKKAHIPTPEATSKSKRRKKSHMLGPPLALPESESSPLGLTDTHFNANLPAIQPQTRNKRQQYRTQTHDKTTETHRDNMKNKSKSTAKRKSAKGAENQLPVAGTYKPSNLERRPSAPSSLTLPRSQRPPLQPSRLRSLGDDYGARAVHPHTHFDEKVPLLEDRRINSTANPATIHRSSTGLRPVASMQELHAQDHVNSANDIYRSNRQDCSPLPNRNDANTAWMYSRAGVDFNRPPSQLDVNIGPNQGDAVDDRYGSSSSSEEEDYLLTSEKSRISLGQNFGFGLSNNPELDLNLEVVGPSLYAIEKTLDHLAPSLHSNDLMLDEETFAKDIRGISTPLNLQGGRSSMKSRNGGMAHPHSELRGTTSFPSRSFHKLSESPPIEDLHKGLTCSGVEQPHRGRPKKDLVVDIVRRLSKNKQEEQDADPDSEQDMELTQAVKSQYFCLDDPHQQISNAALSPSAGQVEEAISWVTDSLISPPTAYIKWKEQNVESLRINEGDDNNGSHPNVLNEGSQRSTTPSDSIITSMSHESPRVADHTITDGRHAAENKEGESDGPTVARNTTKRTRSGTIMPAIPIAISRGVAKRTRSGTIIGPIVASAAATAAENGSRLAGGISSLINTVVGAGKTRQTRSGTIVASASINAMPTTITDSGIGMSISSGIRQQNRSRSGSMLRIVPKAVFQPMSMQNNSAHTDEGRPAAANALLDPETVAAVREVGGIVDSVYFPPSSTDQLDIVFAPTPEEEEGLNDIAEEWRVAAEPPSPEAARKRGKGSNSGGSGHTILGLAARAASAGRSLKSKISRAGVLEGGRTGKGLKAHFEPGVGGSDPEDVLEDELDTLSGTAGVVRAVSDDELLLVPGATALLFR